MKLDIQAQCDSNGPNSAWNWTTYLWKKLFFLTQNWSFYFLLPSPLSLLSPNLCLFWGRRLGFFAEAKVQFKFNPRVVCLRNRQLPDSIEQSMGTVCVDRGCKWLASTVEEETFVLLWLFALGLFCGGYKNQTVHTVGGETVLQICHEISLGYLFKVG